MKPSLLCTTRLMTRLALGGLVLSTGALVPTSAWAQSAPVFDGQGVVELVAPTALVGDGATAADLYVIALGPTGAPLAGIKGKPTASGGSATELTDVGGGIYKFSYTPAKVDSAGTATLTFKGKQGTTAITRTWTVAVAPPRSNQLSVAMNPPQMVLKQDLTASVALNLAGGDRQSLTGVDIAVKPSTGSVDNLIQLGGGQFSALYTAPVNVNYPHVALLTAVDRRDPTHTYGGMAVPLVGKADYPVTVAPNARVILKVAGREFGPIAANAMGQAMVPIVVPPGASNCTKVQIAPDGKVTEEPLDLKIPESRRIALFPSATSIPSDARIQVPIRAMVVTPDGKPDTNAQVVFSTTAGVISPAKHEGNGIYVASYTPPFGNASTQASIAVNLADKPGIQADSLTINLVPARAGRVALTAEPAALPAGADGFKVFAKVTGPDGSGLGSRTVNFSANGARLKGDVKDLRNGDYQATFGTTGNGPVELSATVSNVATGNPLARVLLVPARTRLNSDGVSSAMVTVATVDEFGYPVPNKEVLLKMNQGDGAFPATATTNADGIAQVFYTAGRKNGVVSLSATIGDNVAAATLIQAPDAVALPDVPVSGSKDVAGLVGEWKGSLASVRIEREGMAMAAAAAPPVAVMPMGGGSGAPAKLGMVTDPATVSAGGTVMLRVNVTDAAGRGVGGQQLDFLVSAGTVGAVTDLGGGMYQASLSVPAGVTGEVKVSAATRDGSLSTFLRVPIGGADSAWGTNPFATSTAPNPFATAPAPTPTPAPAPTPAPTAVTPAPTSTTSTTTVTRVPATPGEHPWMRVRAGYSYAGYSYDQTVLNSSTVLFPSPIGLSAGAQGTQIAGRFWVPGVPYLGANAEFRADRYTIAPQPLCTELGRPCEDAAASPDVVLDFQAEVAGRYPFEVGGSQFWVGAKAGFAWSDIQAYKVVDNTIDLPQIGIGSLAIGPEVGVEVGSNVFLQTYFTEYLAGGSVPYTSQFGLSGGYAFGKAGGMRPFVSAAYDFSVRKLEVVNAGDKPVGEIQDSMHTGTVSVGIEL